MITRCHGTSFRMYRAAYNSSRRNLTIYGTVYEGSWTVESLSSCELTISTDDLDFADYGETKIRMTRD